MSEEERQEKAQAPLDTESAENALDEELQAAPPAKAKGGRLRLLLVVIVAAMLGALVTANWKDRAFSFVLADYELKAGLMILASAALGFILGVVFIWSAINRQD